MSGEFNEITEYALALANGVGGKCYRAYCQKNGIEATKEGEKNFKAGMIVGIQLVALAGEE